MRWKQDEENKYWPKIQGNKSKSWATISQKIKGKDEID
jgi:hypothetical protein